MSNWKILLAIGVLFVIAGLLALTNPFAASVAVEQLAGAAFLILGIVQVVEAIRADTWGGKLWSLLLGVVSVLVGIHLLGKPLAGLIGLTMLLGVAFVVSGVFKVLVGLRVQDNSLKWLVILSGVVSAVLGGMVLSKLPGSAIVTLGLMLGIELISNGVAAIGLGLSRKSGGVSHSG